jgi:hypothetical protein
MSEQPQLTPRDALRFILIRYDHGAMAPGVFEVAKELQRHLCFNTSIGRASVTAPESTSVKYKAQRLEHHANG